MLCYVCYVYICNSKTTLDPNLLMLSRSLSVFPIMSKSILMIYIIIIFAQLICFSLWSRRGSSEHNKYPMMIACESMLADFERV